MRERDGIAQRTHLFALVLLTFVLLRGALLAVMLPPWQAPDEPGHFEFAQLVASYGPQVRQHERSAALQQDIIASLARADFWRGVREQPPVPLPSSFDEDRFLVRSGAQVGDEPFLYYALVALVWRLAPGVSIETQLALGRLLSVVLLALVVPVVTFAARAVWPEDAALSWSLPAAVALQPMAAFMGASLNNDAMAILLGAVGCCAALVVAVRGLNMGRGLLCVGILVAGLWTKKTLLFLWPLVGLAVLLGTPALRRAAHRLLMRRGPILLRSAGVGLLVASALVLALSSPAADRPAGWISDGWDGRASRVQLPDGMALALRDRDPDQRALLEQTVSLAGETLRGTLRMTLATDVLSLEARAVEVSLRMSSGLETGETVCTAGGGWGECRLDFTFQAPRDHVQVVLAMGARGHTEVVGDAAWRNVRLTAATDPATNLLANPSGERAATRWVPVARWIENRVHAPRGWLVTLGKPEHLQPGILARDALYVLLSFAGFWGNFGWLQAPLPLPLYGWLALLCYAALLGLAIGVTRTLIARPNGSLGKGAALLVSVGAVLLILGQTLLPAIGLPWQPQGRYLLPALLPISVCLILGLRAGLPRVWALRADAIYLITLGCANIAMFGVIAARW